MPRYLETAKEANKVAKLLMDLATEQADNYRLDRKAHVGEVAECIAKLLNYGIRGAPRAVQSTVRLRFVQTATEGLPVKVTMETREDPDTGKSYNVLITEGCP